MNWERSKPCVARLSGRVFMHPGGHLKDTLRLSPPPPPPSQWGDHRFLMILNHESHHLFCTWKFERVFILCLCVTKQLMDGCKTSRPRAAFQVVHARCTDDFRCARANVAYTLFLLYDFIGFIGKPGYIVCTNTHTTILKEHASHLRDHFDVKHSHVSDCIYGFFKHALKINVASLSLIFRVELVVQKICFFWGSEKYITKK